MNRYTRQMQVPGVGAEGQSRLAAAHVLIVGAGGLGCTIIPALAAAGIGRLTIADPDHVELTNLHRQTLYTAADSRCAAGVALCPRPGSGDQRRSHAAGRLRASRNDRPAVATGDTCDAKLA